MTLASLVGPHLDGDIQPVFSSDRLEVSLPTKALLVCSQCQRECRLEDL